MSFISYAQNFEDVMLWRALKHIERGCYVDVGAQHPVVDSVSKAFYEHGWRGVHIEPMPEYAELLRKDRPDEAVLQVALADTEGTLELNVIPDTGLSTAVDAYAQRHQVERGLEYQRIQVPILTLKSALTLLVGKEVHWLKIDVEGLEEQVLKGWDSQILRPWIIVVEATIPYSPETRYQSWEPILTAADYQFAYFDGLNRFYVAKEHGELIKSFSCPPNVFDGVQLSGLASSELCRGLIASHQASEKELAAQAQKLAIELNAANEHNTKLQAHAEWLQSEWDAAKQRVEEFSQRTVQLGAELQAALAHESRLQAHAQWLQNEWDTAKAKIGELNRFSHHWWSVTGGLNRELQRVCAGKSWQVTRWLRRVLSLLKRMAKPFVVWTMRQGLANPRLKAYALDVLSKYPELRQRLRQFAIRSDLITGDGTTSPIGYSSTIDSVPHARVTTTIAPDIPQTLKNLSPRATRIYADLKKSIEAKRR